MNFQAAFLLLMVTSLSHYVHCQRPAGACEKGIKCYLTSGTELIPTAYNVHEDTLLCTGASINAPPSLACPATMLCYGGKVGLSSTGTNIGSGPCLPAPTVCSAAGSFSMIYQGKRACQAYYDCVVDVGDTSGFQAYPRACAGELEFNSVTKVCEPASTANCSTALAPATAATAAPVTNATANTTVSVSSNVTASVTVASVAPTATVATTVAPPTCSGWGKLPDPNSCRHFYKCGVFGRRSRKRCLFNLRFDVDANACRRNAACGTRPLVSA